MKDKVKVKIAYICSVLLLIHAAGAHHLILAGNKVAIVEGVYDNIELVFKNYRIPYDLIKLYDIQDINIIKNYSSIYLPSGVGIPLHKKINLISRGTRIKSVVLDKDADKIDENKIAINIRTFIEHGGSVYFSGYSFKYLQIAYKLFKFFNNFPYMGLPGRIITDNENDYYRFSLNRNSPLYITYPGWIAVKSADDVEILSTGSFNTPRGERKGPLSFILKRGMGEAVYTSYYSTVFSSFRRFNIYRIAGSGLLKRLYLTADKFQQEVTGRIVDSVLDNELSRTYLFNLYPGNNTIYFTTDTNKYQLDIFDKNMSLVTSIDSNSKDITFDFISKVTSICYVRIYPSTGERYGIYSIISASGDRYFPYFKRTAIISAGILLLMTIIAMIRLFGGKKYTGRSIQYR